MSKARLTRRDQLYFAVGLACTTTGVTLDALFSDTMLLWMRFIQVAFLLAGIGFLAVYIVQVNRKV